MRDSNPHEAVQHVLDLFQSYFFLQMTSFVLVAANHISPGRLTSAPLLARVYDQRRVIDQQLNEAKHFVTW